MSGLPYDGTPPPDERVAEPSALDRPLGEYSEPSALDRPLDDYEAPREVPEHVQSLMGRMSKGKVYLLEESLGVDNTGEDERIRRDPVSYQLPVLAKRQADEVALGSTGRTARYARSD